MKAKLYANRLGFFRHRMYFMLPDADFKQALKLAQQISARYDASLQKLPFLFAGKRRLAADRAQTEAFRAGEGADAVAFDPVVLYADRNVPALTLPKGKVHIRAIDKTREILGQYGKDY